MRLIACINLYAMITFDRLPVRFSSMLWSMGQARLNGSTELFVAHACKRTVAFGLSLTLDRTETPNDWVWQLQAVGRLKLAACGNASIRPNAASIIFRLTHSWCLHSVDYISSGIRECIYMYYLPVNCKLDHLHSCCTHACLINYNFSPVLSPLDVTWRSRWPVGLALAWRFDKGQPNRSAALACTYQQERAYIQNKI